MSDPTHGADLRIRELHESLRRGDRDITDAKLIRAVEACAAASYPSALAAASHLFGVIVPICVHRPSLASRLLEFPAWGLYAMFDKGTEATAWLSSQFNRPDDFNSDDLAWLKTLIAQPERLQTLFDRFAEEWEEDV